MNSMKSSEGFFAGKKTKVWIAKYYGIHFIYVRQYDIMEKLNLTFYHDRKTRSVIAHTVNEKGVSEFNGIIDSDKVIRSLNNVKRIRRDVPSKSPYESENNSLKNYHVLYKREVSPTNIRNTNYSPNPTPDYHDFRNIDETPKIVYPEILIYVDTTIFLHFNRSIEKTVAYVLTFWNTVDLYFREMDDPSVRLSIAGIVVCEDPIEPMDEYIISFQNLIRFSFFMFNQRNFYLTLDYDIVVFFVKPRIFQKVIGISYERGVCRIEALLVKSTAIISDSGNFDGILTAVHEIGHVLGSPHDDNKDMSKEEIERCTFKNGFVMSYHGGTENQFYFSPCSKEKMKLTLSSEASECVRNNPAVGRTDDQMLSTFSGQYMSADEQCISRDYERAFVSPRICAELECVKYHERVSQIIPALEGTPCDVESVCLMGKCVKIESDRSDINSDLNVLFPNHFQPYKTNKSLEEQCKERELFSIFESATLSFCELTCTFKTYLSGYRRNRKFIADDGTVCNSNGYCLNGTCYDEIYKSAEKQCINYGASSFLGYCNNGKCVNITITSTTVSTIETTTPLDKYKSPKERCKDISMAWMYDFNDGCITYCKNEENKGIDENLVAEEGYPCDNNGTCEDGNCVNMTIVSDKWPIFKSPSERYKIIGMTLAKNHNTTNCTITCASENALSIRGIFKIDEKIVFQNLTAEDGYPCKPARFCLTGKCVDIKISDNVNNRESTNWNTDELRVYPKKRIEIKKKVFDSISEDDNVAEDFSNDDEDEKNLASDLGIEF
ncbi:zinc metalloproteinase-disintegrin-like VLAIP-A isoform X2 [Leptopilina heterotoma]|uniref:zinc metalloproteinase-disintegrin-like VLAIP-A isoform X2 n=1 Tax=Leptopilina heterotoma TaxID=63436 RepID=UPI001CA9A18C|nr:zinc metalloproteinase-disintegrin-like VLAIP-A isoform X2 [Leptopilina heterotoma]